MRHSMTTPRCWRTSGSSSRPVVALHSGFEIMLDTGDVRPHGSPARDWPARRRAWWSFRVADFRRARRNNCCACERRDCVPVVAHPERYQGCTMETITTWRELGAVIQCDAMALLGGGPMTEFARAMLGAGLVDILASDNHGDRRSLVDGRDVDGGVWRGVAGRDPHHRESGAPAGGEHNCVPCRRCRSSAGCSIGFASSFSVRRVARP